MAFEQEGRSPPSYSFETGLASTADVEVVRRAGLHGRKEIKAIGSRDEVSEGTMDEHKRLRDWVALLLSLRGGTI